MSVTLQPIVIGDSLADGEVKINANDAALSAGIDAVQSALDTHKGPGGHAAYDAYAAQIAAKRNTFAVVFSFDAGSFVPKIGTVAVLGSMGPAMPAGKITGIYVTTVGGGVVGATGTLAFAAGAKIGVSVDAGVIMPRAGGVNAGFAAASDDDIAFVTIYGELN